MSWTQEQIDAVWSKLPVVIIGDNTWKKDLAGAWINFDEHGNTGNAYGWEIDHIYPESKGGKSDLNNLQALHWQNNRSKGDDYPTFTTEVTSNGNQNIFENKQWKYN